MTTGKGNDALPARGEDFAQAWQDTRADASIQYDRVELPDQPPPPDWLIQFMHWLGDVLSPIGALLVHLWPFLYWILIAGGVALLAYVLWRLIGPALGVKRKTSREEEWVPDQQEALALLEEADRLAAEGRYDEATHLLLRRSVGQIAQARPDIVEPSSTARELSAEPRIPEGARTAFAVIAGRVERSLFALAKLSSDDWQAARDAYSDFALQQRSLAA
ncbi:hypothetical protein CP97_04365 [Aurantiacibacter atlanticus]|uniref:DUF4129 domain-containing protein n=1 Tax=Aurantiacibacter atlanticus TaxID=1648404 RepID=A0A0H4VWH6_9SPHN|nr:hypothetical protein [Aurantiacibacter atlanticus]AKQ41428.1 hypothetical protein CP97_04365 [Aurantiacibacter atlanticus]